MSDDLSGDMLAPSWPNLVCLMRKVFVVKSTMCSLLVILSTLLSSDELKFFSSPKCGCKIYNYLNKNLKKVNK